MISNDDAKMMFSNSLVQYKNELAYIMDITREGFLYFELKDQKIKSAKSDYLDLKPITTRLGYLDFGSICAFVFRKPVRRYKVGICKDNLSIRFGDIPYTEKEKEFIHSTVYTFTSQAYVQTHKNEYHTLGEALHILDKGGKVVPFDRQFAIDHKHRLYYKGILVGNYNSSANVFYFIKGKEYLESVITNRSL